VPSSNLAPAETLTNAGPDPWLGTQGIRELTGQFVALEAMHPLRQARPLPEVPVRWQLTLSGKSRVDCSITMRPSVCTLQLHPPCTMWRGWPRIGPPMIDSAASPGSFSDCLRVNWSRGQLPQVIF
jgi:hypothetical protein